MNKATSTLTQARNIAMALTMTFAASTLAACGSDDSADNTQASEAEVSTENQSNVSNDTAQTETEVEAESSETNESTETAETEPESMTSEEETVASNTTSANETATETQETNDGEPEIHTVRAVGLKYDPLVVTIKPGDSVAWRNMNTHNTKSLEGLIPEGTEHWNSPMSQDYERTFTEEGIYVYKCTPHFGSGMGGAIIVGKPVNLDQLKNADASGAAGRLVRKAISEAENM